MPAIKRLFEACRVSFTPSGPASSDALNNVRAMLDKIKPSDVGLEHEAQLARGWKDSLNDIINGKKGRNGSSQSSPPIKYLHIYECESFSMGIFCMPASSVIPLHNHPEMTVLSKLLYGSLHVTAYDWIDIDKANYQSQDVNVAKPSKLIKDVDMSAPCGTTTLFPSSGGNIHCFRALTPCALFDILSPPYSSSDGRHCSYFQYSTTENQAEDLVKGMKFAGVDLSELVWLEEIQPPESFVVKRGVYKGRPIGI